MYMKEGSREVFVDNMGRIVEEIGVTKEPQAGQDVWLSMDTELQNAAYDMQSAKTGFVQLVQLWFTLSCHRNCVLSYHKYPQRRVQKEDSGKQHSGAPDSPQNKADGSVGCSDCSGHILKSEITGCKRMCDFLADHWGSVFFSRCFAIKIRMSRRLIKILQMRNRIGKIMFALHSRLFDSVYHTVPLNQNPTIQS